MKLPASLALVCLLPVATANIGTGLWRDYTVFAPMPVNVTDAVAQGWVLDPASPPSGSNCSPNLGIRYTPKNRKFSRLGTKTPIELYFTPAGQIAGVGTIVHGMDDFPLAGGKGAMYWSPAPDLGTHFGDLYRIMATFRAPGSGPDSVCSETVSQLLMGDRVVINQGRINQSFSIPLNQSGAIDMGFQTGSCFASMGTHSFFDLETKGEISWRAETMLPVVAMYDRNNNWRLNAIFFTTPKVQQTALPPNANQWEPIPLPNAFMCKNFCDKNCGWESTYAWSTMHIYFADPHKVTCENDCQIGCCEKN